MKNDFKFRKNLMIKYLVRLTEKDHRDEFNVYYNRLQEYIQQIVDDPESAEQLEDARKIIAYKQNEKSLGM